MEGSKDKKGNIRNIAMNLRELFKQQLEGQKGMQDLISGLINAIGPNLSENQAVIGVGEFCVDDGNAFQAKNIILCLTLRKVFSTVKERLKKFGFHLLRSLYIDQKNQSKQKKLNFNYFQRKALRKSRNQKFAAIIKKHRLSNIRIYLLKWKKAPKNNPIVISVLKSIFSHAFYIQKLWSFHKIKLFSNSSKKILFTKVRKLNRSLIIPLKRVYMHKWKNVLQKNYIASIIGLSCISSFKNSCGSYGSVNSTPLVSSRENKAIGAILLPRPKSIHDYIDDMLETASQEADFAYFSTDKDF